MKKQLLYLSGIFALIVTLSIISCKKADLPSDEKNIPTELNISESSLTFKVDADFKEINLTCNNNWTITSSQPEWLTVDKLNGNGNSAIKISVTENKETSKRQGILTFASGTLELKLNVEQDEAGVFYASTATQGKVAVLEDFTGVRCGYCPDGHVKAKAMKDANPSKVIVLAVHGGSYATPMAGWMDFTTPFGSALISQSKVAGYPAGTINRIPASDLGVSPQISGGMAMSRGSWMTAGNKVQSETAPVNLGGMATWDASTREATVRVDIYYTSATTDPTNLNVALVQDGVGSKQSGATGTYMQNNILRTFITGQWGEVVATTATVGTKITKTYKIYVPEFYNGSGVDGGGASDITKMRIAAFACAGKVNILNGVEIDIK